jgi:succinyl-diaminopimelate desuccinylase
VTPAGPLTDLMQAAISDVTGKNAELSTSGGTSDARFITHLCPVAEFGLVGQTMHKVDEHVLTDDIDQLTAIYLAMLSRFFEVAR